MASPARAIPDALPIGRETEATRLAHLIEDTVAGAKRAVLLLGPPGIGKTTLLRWARDRAEQRDCIIAAVRIPAAAGLPPRFPLGELLDGLVEACGHRGLDLPGRLSRAAATLTGSGSTDGHAVSLPQIADAIEEVGRAGPLAIFIDDYHWAPVEGTEILLAALRVVETSLCFIASARLRGLDDVGIALPEPTADLWVEHVEVRGLEHSAVGELAAELLGDDVLPSLSEALYAHTLGNPLFVTETLQGWREHRALVRTGGYWGLSDERVPREAGSLREMIASRIARLGKDALSVARSLAVIGREADFEELAALTEMPEHRLVETIGALVGDGLVDGEAHLVPRYRLAHPLYATALLDDESIAERGLLHARMCAELRRRGQAGRTTSAAELAHHAVRSLAHPPDVRVLLTAAAREAETAGSFEEAADWYGRLAELADDPAELVAAIRGQATAAIQTDPHRAIELFSYGLNLEAGRDSRTELLIGRARAHRVAGSADQALSDLEAALASSDPLDSFDLRHARGALYGMMGRIEEAESVFIELADESSGTPDHCKAIGHLGMVALTKGDILRAVDLQEASLHDCEDEAYASYLRSNLCWQLAIVGRWDEADRMIDELLAAAVTFGDIWSEASALCAAGRLAAWRGDLARAFDDSTRARRLAGRLGNPADLIETDAALATALMENDMAIEAAAMLPEVLALDRPGGETREFGYTFTLFAEASLLSGDVTRARTALTRARAHLPGAPFWVVAVDRCEAQIDLACDDAARALGRLRRWLDQPSPLVFEQARLVEVAARAHLALNDRSGAEARAAQALDTYGSLGAARRATRIAAWLDELRARKRGRPRSELPGHLTEREREILRLVALGRSNQGVADELVISIGTVKKHVENVMAKAGVSRRTELVPFAISVGVVAAEDLVSEREATRRRAASIDVRDMRSSRPGVRVPTD